MAFDTSRFWDAFDRAGLLERVEVHSGGQIFSALVGVGEGGLEVLDSMVHADTLRIEYQAKDLPGLRVDDIVLAQGTRHRVLQPPVRSRDGGFMTAFLGAVQ